MTVEAGNAVLLGEQADSLASAESSARVSPEARAVKGGGVSYSPPENLPGNGFLIENHAVPS